MPSAREIAKLPKRDRIWAEGATTYCYRVIKDTDRLSMHSFGIAIDLAPTKTQYWKDEAPNETDKIGYKNTMPLSIVRIFEKHGFIWGGRWYHYGHDAFRIPSGTSRSFVRKTR